MMRRYKVLLSAGAGVAALGALLLVPGQLALSADHLDPPGRTDPAVTARADIPADIADHYAFYDANNLYIAMSFAGPANPGVPAFYDPNVLYTFNISNNAPATSADISIRFRFGPATNGTGNGVSVENLPGVNGPLVGPVETVLTKDGVQAYAGLRDDPFTFDLIGFRETRSMNAIRFRNDRNFFGNKNDTVLVLAIPRSRVGAGPFDISVTSARFGGLL